MDQERVVVQIGIQMGTTVLVCCQQICAVVHTPGNERGATPRRIEPVSAPENARRARHPADHQRIPTDQNFVVATGPDTPLADGEQLASRAVEYLLCLNRIHPETSRYRIDRLKYVQMPVTLLEVGLAIEAIMRRYYRILVFVEH